MTHARRSFLLAAIVAATSMAGAEGGSVAFFDDGSLALKATDPAGVQEPAVPIYYNGTLIGGENHQVVEAYDQVPGTSSYPLTLADLAANTYVRPTYQKANGQTGSLGSSIIGSPSFRTPAGLQLIPTVTRADVTTGGSARYTSVVQGNFGSSASLTSARTFPDPAIGNTTVDMSVQLNLNQDVSLATASQFVDNDRFRMLTISSMFASATQYDSNVLRFEDAQGIVHTIQLSDATPRGQYVFASPIEIGNWFEVIKTPGSQWYADSPTLHVDILAKNGLQLAIQGYLAGTTDPNDDSLSWFLEVLNCPDTLPSGATYAASYRISALPPAAVPEPTSATLVCVAASILVGYRRFGKTRMAPTHARFWGPSSTSGTHHADRPSLAHKHSYPFIP